MISKMGSISCNFSEESKQRLVPSQKEDYADVTVTSGSNQQGQRSCCCCWLPESITSSWRFVLGTVVSVWKFARSDPRNPIFGAKMGLTLVLISLLVFLKEPFDYIGDYCAWAIFTAVLIFEYSIGATFQKGLNRAFGTISAGGLALLMAQLSIWTGIWEEYFIVLSIFVVAFAANFAKQLTKEYEYGFRVFVLTYGVIMVSGLTMSEFTKTAATRFLLIVIGAAVSLIVNTCIYPIWAGEELHSLVVKNFMDVATSLEGCINGYLQCFNYERVPSRTGTYQVSIDPIHQKYMSVIKSTNLEATLEGFASWEPPHGPYKTFNYPWKNYVKVSGALRHCTFTVMALHGCMISEIQAPPEWRQVFSMELHNVGIEAAKVLRKLGTKVKNMEKLSPGDILANVHKAAEALQEKVDKRLCLLVNADRWDIEKRPKKQSTNEHNEIDLLGIESLSAGLNFRSAPVLTGLEDYRRDGTSLKYYRPDNISSQTMLHDQIQWHSQFSVSSETLHTEGESKSYGSACALSLARFASLSVEFVARLDNLVFTFEELVDKAKFKEPIVEKHLAGAEVVGFWSRFFRCFRKRT